jgi:hypothetical protein
MWILSWSGISSGFPDIHIKKCTRKLCKSIWFSDMYDVPFGINQICSFSENTLLYKSSHGIWSYFNYQNVLWWQPSWISDHQKKNIFGRGQYTTISTKKHDFFSIEYLKFLKKKMKYEKKMDIDRHGQQIQSDDNSS